VREGRSYQWEAICLSWKWTPAFIFRRTS